MAKPEHTEDIDWRSRVAQLRQELQQTTAAYRTAVRRRDSANVVTLLRNRSKLMRELLDAQCQVLVRLRVGIVKTDSAPAPSSRAEASPVV